MKQYEIKDSIHSVCIDGVWHERNEIRFTYRHSHIQGIISAVRFIKRNGFDTEKEMLFTQMRANQPKEPSCGSCFKNPSGDSAGRLIDEVGLRGYSIGGMSFSVKHANFLVNLGSGCYNEACKLVELAKTRVKEYKGIDLELEIIHID